MSPAALPEEFFGALESVRSRLGSFATDVRWYPEVGSTNDVASRLAEAGVADGTLVLADTQTAGRGRLGRAWTSPAGAGIYATLVLRPGPSPVSLIPIAAGVAISEGIQSATGLVTHVKWPNDIVIPGAPGSGDPSSVSSGVSAFWKLAGVLAEGGLSTDGSRWVVLGFGINVRAAAYPPDLVSRATSLEAELGRQVDRGLVLGECLAAFAGRYAELGSGKGASIVEEWRRRARTTLGRPVEWDANGHVSAGVAHDIDGDGALLVRTPHETLRIISGEVRWT